MGLSKLSSRDMSCTGCLHILIGICGYWLSVLVRPLHVNAQCQIDIVRDRALCIPGFHKLFGRLYVLNPQVLTSYLIIDGPGRKYFLKKVGRPSRLVLKDKFRTGNPQSGSA